MFTGIVEALGRVVGLERRGRDGRLTIALPAEADWRLETGESVAVSGVCLTVVERGGGRVAFDLAAETLAVTTLGGLAPGDPVNLERPLRLDGRLGGHLVLGHADGVGTVRAVTAEGEGRRLTVEVPGPMRPYLCRKGSIAVDGVSLTVADVDGTAFSAALIPHTLTATTLGVRQAGDRVNLEVDVVGKYVVEATRAYQAARAGAGETIDGSG